MAMAACNLLSEMQEPSIDTDKLSYEIFSILESKFLFGYGDNNNTTTNNNNHNNNNLLSWIPKQISPSPSDSSTGGVNLIKNQRGKICILTIDGGGMRNIISGKALEYLELSLKAKSGDPNARIADYFDVAAGSGVGGIFTAMLFATKDHRTPVVKAEDTWRFLAEQGSKFYTSSSSSSSKSSSLKRLLKLKGKGISMTSSTRSMTSSLEKLIKEKFTNLTLKDTLKPVLIPCYDLSSTAPFLFSRADALENDNYNFRLWEVCRATSAEPGIFDPVSIRSIDGSTRCVGVDGGLAMGNPTAAAITHVLHNKQEFPFVRGVEDILVISIGTGQLLEGSYGHEEVKSWKSKEWARPMARISGDGYADLVDQAIAKAFGQWRPTNYVRIQANGSSFGRCGPNVDTDASPNNVKMLVEVGDEMLKQKNVESVLFGGKRIGEQSNAEKLDWFAQELVLEHQRRSCRIAPTVAFKQANPTPT